MHEFRLPDVGEGLDQAEIVTWLVAEGDVVARDQPLVEILTDKSQTELPSPVAGTIARLGFAEGDMAEVGQTLVEFSGLDQQADDTPPIPTPATPPTATAPVAAVRADSRGGRVKAAPAVRKRALEAGFDLGGLVGTGPGGRVTQDDLDRALAAAEAAPSPTAPGLRARPIPPAAGVEPTGSSGPTIGQMAAGRHPLRGIRRVTAETMERAWQVPHIHGADEFDATNLLAGRRRIKEIHGDRADRLTPLSFFVMAVADGLARFPLLNASVDTEAGHIDVHPEINVGIAVATEAGLVVPVIANADRRSLLDLAAEIARLSTDARAGRLSAAEMQGGTCTVTNYGSMGGRYAAPIIRPPEVAIVGFGAIDQRPIVIDGDVVARPTLPIAVGCDHRLIDGDLMTAFQEHLIAVLGDPVALLAR